MCLLQRAGRGLDIERKAYGKFDWSVGSFKKQKLYGIKADLLRMRTVPLTWKLVAFGRRKRVWKWLSRHDGEENELKNNADG